MPTIIATPGAPDANSYTTLAEFKAYLADRLHVPAAVSSTTDPTLESALIAGTRALDQILSGPYRRLEIQNNGALRFYVISSYWTGSPASATQSLAWPRIGMFDRNGNAIASNVIPLDLKIATYEMSILAITTELGADNATIVSGLTSLKAGPVALEFKDFIQLHTLPNIVRVALVPSWITAEEFEQAQMARFGVIGPRNT